MNPHALPGGTGPCPPLADHLVDWSKSYREKYFPLMVELGMFTEEVVQLLCYLTFGMPSETRVAVDAVLDEFHQARGDEHTFAGLLHLAETMLSMNDTVQQHRLNWFLHGENVPPRAGGVVQNEAPLPGFLDLTIAPNMLMYKRFVMLRWLVNAHDAERPSFMQPPPEVCLQAMAVRAPRSCSASRALRADAWRSRSTWRT